MIDLDLYYPIWSPLVLLLSGLHIEKENNEKTNERKTFTLQQLVIHGANNESRSPEAEASKRD